MTNASVSDSKSRETPSNNESYDKGRRFFLKSVLSVLICSILNISDAFQALAGVQNRVQYRVDPEYDHANIVLRSLYSGQIIRGAAGIIKKALDKRGGLYITSEEMDKYFWEKVMRGKNDIVCGSNNDPNNGPVIAEMRGKSGSSKPDFWFGKKIVYRMLEKGRLVSVAAENSKGTIKEAIRVAGQPISKATVWLRYPIYNGIRNPTRILVEVKKAYDSRYIAASLNKQTEHVLIKAANGNWLFGTYWDGTLRYVTTEGITKTVTGPLYLVVEIGEDVLRNIFDNCRNYQGGGGVGGDVVKVIKYAVAAGAGTAATAYVLGHQGPVYIPPMGGKLAHGW